MLTVAQWVTLSPLRSGFTSHYKGIGTYIAADPFTACGSDTTVGKRYFDESRKNYFGFLGKMPLTHNHHSWLSDENLSVRTCFAEISCHSSYILATLPKCFIGCKVCWSCERGYRNAACFCFFQVTSLCRTITTPCPVTGCAHNILEFALISITDFMGNECGMNECAL